MSAGIADDLARALVLTERMVEAAKAQNWGLVVELDEARQPSLAALQAVTLDAAHRASLLALDQHNRVLGELAGLAHKGVEQQMEQYQYNHRALRTYVDSSSTQ